jgi:diguanylate cyclase (GGDEF)-like protein
MYLLVKTWNESTGEKKNQIQWVLYSNIPSLTVGFWYNLVLVLAGNYRYIWVGPLCTSIMVIISFYAMATHKLMDINYKGKQFSGQFVYVIITILTLGMSVYVLHQLLLPLYASIVLISIASVLGIPHLYNWLMPRLEPIMLGKSYAYVPTLRKNIFEKHTLYTRQEISKILIDTIGEHMKIEKLAVFVRDNDNHFSLIEKRGFGENQQFLAFTLADKVNDFLKEHRCVSLKEFASNTPETAKSLLNIMIECHAEFVLSVVTNEEITALVFVGEKTTRNMFNSKDIALLREKVKEAEAKYWLAELIEQQNALQIIKSQEAHEQYQQELFDAAQQIIDNKDLDKLSEETTHISARSTQATDVHMCLLNKEQTAYVCVATLTDEQEHTKDSMPAIPIDHALCGFITEYPNAYITYEKIAHLKQEAGTQHFRDIETFMRERGIRVLIPLLFKYDGLLGWIEFGPKRHDAEYTPYDLKTCLLLLQYAKQAVRHIMVSQDAITDGLTGLYLRKYLDKCLLVDVMHVAKTGQPLSVIMIDLDYFKKKNDTYGHQFGDLILEMLARYIRNNIRPGDGAFRYGGEEFVIVLHNTDIDIAGKIAHTLCEGLRIALSPERVREAAKRKPLPAEILEKLEHIPVNESTGSFGVSCCRSNGELYTKSDALTICGELMSRADEEVYNAKHTGRNKVCVSKPFTKDDHMRRVYETKLLAVVADDIAKEITRDVFMPGLDIITTNTLENVADFAKQYTSILIDHAQISIDIVAVCATLQTANEDINLGVITSNPAVKQQLQQYHPHVFIHPVDTSEISNWLRGIAYSKHK